MPAVPPYVALEARAAFTDPDGQPVVRVDPGEAVIASVNLSTDAYAWS